ncbi:MAG: peptide-methionine (R)-S-oxide reductase MsrB [Clostridia bacterium]
MTSTHKEIYLAGGCFWGVQAFLKKIPGVIETSTGYANGKTNEPTYEDVCRRGTGHAEAVRVSYNPEILSLPGLLAFFFRIIDPTSVNKQGNDTGVQYRTGIYYTDPEDLALIQGFLEGESKKHRKPLAVEALPLENYGTAEEYHQDYLDKNPGGYCHINLAAANEIIREVSEESLRKKLTPIQYAVTRENATEPPFSNMYWDNKDPGLYVDVITGDPLFTSSDKFDSGCGWPSFTKPLSNDIIEEKIDKGHGMSRIEVRSQKSASHLGHVFKDGPKDKGGLRYCINSASLRFIPLSKLEEEGYGAYLELFNP